MDARIKHAFPLLIIFIFLLSLAPVQVFAQDLQCYLDPNSGPAGTGVGISGKGFTPDQKGQVLWYDGSYLGETYIDSYGNLSGSFFIPGYAEPGTYDVMMATEIEKSYCSFTVFPTKPPEEPTSTDTPYIPPPIDTDTPTKNPGQPHTSTFTPSRTPTKFPGYINTSTFTPSRTPTNALESPPPPPSNPNQIMVNNIAPMLPLFDNPTSILGGSVSRVARGSPCSSLNLGERAIVINFEDAPTGMLINRYPDVSFQQGEAFVQSPSVRTHSGGHAVGSYFVSDLGSINHPIVMNFTQPMSAVGLYVGREAPSDYANESVVAVLTGFGSTPSGIGIVAQNEIDLPGQPTNIDRCLSITAPLSQPITHATLEFLNSNGRSVYDRRWMDDLTLVYNTFLAGPDRPPMVSITRPMNNAVITTDAVYLQVDVTEDFNLAQTGGLVMHINGSSNAQQLIFVRDATNPVHYQATTIINRNFLSAFGQNSIRVVATDTSRQTGEAQVSFTFRPASGVDILIEAMEVTQVTQYFPENMMPLYANKPTLVRVYAHVLSGPSEISGISGALCLGITGSTGCTNPLRPFSPITIYQTSSRSIDDLRNDLNLTLNFLLPMDWIRASEDPIHITLYVNFDQENVLECCYENNFLSSNFYVSQGKLINILPIGIIANGYTADLEMRWDTALGLKETYPASRAQAYGGSGQFLDLGTFDFHGGGWDSLLRKLWIMAQGAFYSVPDLHWYAMVPAEAIGDAAGGKGMRPGPVSGGFSTRSDIPGSVSIAAEEIAHNYGRQHATSYRGASDPDTNYPFPEGTIDQVGINVNHLRLFPITSGDFMSYHIPHSSRWVSTYTYEAMYYALNNMAFNLTSMFSDNFDMDFHLIGLLQQAAMNTYLMGSGLITPQSIEFPSAFFKISRNSASWDGLPSGPYTMELQDKNGNILFSRSFNVSLTDSEPSDSGFFGFLVPWQDGTTAMVFKHDEQEIGRRTASLHTPSVTILSPNGGETWENSVPQNISWNAEDKDGDTLVYMVQYTCDNGKTWVNLGSELTASQLTVEPGHLPGGDKCLVRVLASDGLNTAADITDGSFMVARKGPEVYISNPQNESNMNPGWPVILSAIGTDPEDGPLPESSLTWNSDRDGNLGSGDYLLASTQKMSSGLHTITLTGTDSNGQTASFRTQINLLPPENAAIASPLGMVRPHIQTFMTVIIILGVIIVISGIFVVLLLLFRRR